MTDSFTDGFIPSAAILNAIQADTCEVYRNTAARDEQTYETGALVWIVETGELQSYDGMQWVVQASLPEQARIVRHPQKIPLSSNPRFFSLDEVFNARRSGLQTIAGNIDPFASSNNVATGAFELLDFYNHVGAVSFDEQTEAYNSVDDIAEKYNYPMPVPTLGNSTRMIQFLNDFPYETIVMTGVSSLIFHRDLRCQIITIGSGGYAGAAGQVSLDRDDSTQLSAIAGGGGGAGSLHSVVIDVKAGDLFEARCGGRISYTGEQQITSQILRDGFTLDSCGQASAVWLNGRPIGQAQGGSRGGTNPNIMQGRESSEEAYYLSGASQGGSAGNAAAFSRFPAPDFIQAEYANRGGGSPGTFGSPHVLAAGGGGGGALGEGGEGGTIDFPEANSRRYAEGGAGGDGVELEWNGVPEICKGGKGGSARGFVGVDDEIMRPQRNWGWGAKGASIIAEPDLPASAENAHLNLARNLPGLGAVLIRFVYSGVDGNGNEVIFEETEIG